MGSGIGQPTGPLEHGKKDCSVERALEGRRWSSWRHVRQDAEVIADRDAVDSTRDRVRDLSGHPGVAVLV